MTRVYQIDINHCYACPHHYRPQWVQADSRMLCMKIEYKEIIGVDTSKPENYFPDWCPLPLVDKVSMEDSRALQELARQDGEIHGVDTGKREVVRWIENNTNLTCTNYEWETQKKKWGIHETN